MSINHWFGLVQETEYCVSPLPMFFIEREKVAKSPGLAPRSLPVPARIVRSPSTLSTTEAILIL